ncbi:MAG: argininosuccinate synthase [Thermoproteota archaeon]|nr:argininosuccinate synthase [Candidatus Brockarchaeota archaeon]
MKVVLAYSGGLDTSVMIKWLQEKYGAEVVTVTVDVGQKEDFGEVEHKALRLGAKKHYTIDAKEEFVRDYIFPAIMANALYEEKYPLSSALSRPLISKKLVEVALKENADTIAHGSTGKGNDQVRFETTVMSLNPKIKVLAPVREWNLSRNEELVYAKEKGIPIKIKSSPYSIDQNLWGRSIEAGVLEDPSLEPPEDAFELTVDPTKAPDNPEYVKIKFENGVPTAINNSYLDSVSLISYLNELAGKHGVGRIDHIEDRLVGIKSREVYECPAAVTLIEAHKELEKLVLTKNELMFKQLIDQTWTNLTYDGLWINPLRLDLEAFIKETQKRVYGEVKVKLFKGSVSVVSRSSPYSLYDVALSTYDSQSKFDQTLAKGFIEIWSLQTRAAYNAMKNNKLEAYVQ